jgi:hypothetical protein
MKTLTTAAAALALTAMMAVGPNTEAKADGGAIAIGVGAYLLVDAIVGRKCHRQDWPFNTLAKIADELHGRHGCHRHGSKDHHHHDRKYR